MNNYMEKAKQNAIKGIENAEGGPFGAVIVDDKGNIIANGNNKILSLKQIDKEECIEVMKQYKGTIY